MLLLNIYLFNNTFSVLYTHWFKNGGLREKQTPPQGDKLVYSLG